MKAESELVQTRYSNYFFFTVHYLTKSVFLQSTIKDHVTLQ